VRIIPHPRQQTAGQPCGDEPIRAATASWPALITAWDGPGRKAPTVKRPRSLKIEKLLLNWIRLQCSRAGSFGQLAAFGREWGARVFIVGHEPAPEGVLVRPPNMVVLNTGHAAGRVIDLDLAAPAPEAAELAATAVPVSALLSDMPDGPCRTAAGEGERLA